VIAVPLYLDVRAEQQPQVVQRQWLDAIQPRTDEQGVAVDAQRKYGVLLQPIRGQRRDDLLPPW
jgi:hypothetical protein